MLSDSTTWSSFTLRTDGGWEYTAVRFGGSGRRGQARWHQKCGGQRSRGPDTVASKMKPTTQRDRSICWDGRRYCTPLGRGGRPIEYILAAAGNREGTRTGGDGPMCGRNSRHRPRAQCQPTALSRGQLSSIVPPSIQRRHATARFPLYPTEVPSSAKRSQERDQPCRSSAGRPGGLTSFATKPQDRISNPRSCQHLFLRPQKPGTQRYVYKCI